MKKYFKTAAKTALILVYLVIVAGALVRMTGSGMGCPDWPKCFGYYIPPTEKAKLLWSPNRDFEKGQVIIVDEKLLVAKADFTSGSSFNQDQFEAFTKHNYAEFDATKTWIEYINRLVGALAGLVVFLMAILSFTYWNENKKITLFSWLSVILMGFQGWLGATVVYSVLNPVRITLHMMVALLIVSLLLYIISQVNPKTYNFKVDKIFKNVLIATLILTFIQIVLGTQVRQYVDEQVKILGYQQMSLVLENPSINFYIHRSFSILILALNAFLFLRNRKMQLGFNKINWIMALIIIEIASGVAMYYLHFPIGTQPIHLVIATLLFGIQFFLIIETRKILN
ncbi:COX15/CtaA family protein [Flavobacterium sp.]|uniref:COX15/CtaA family protein n=1 Tax=Flavobacterium sp. TaxID=239 RepID=UPI00286BDD18|nr:COX15/CtaA family protein [Flavobacterium sp.]